MRSRAELALSIAAALAVVVLIAAILRPGALPSSASAGAADVRALRDWTVHPRAESMVVTLGDRVDPITREWLGALRASGTGIQWSGGPVAEAAEIQREGAPGGAVVARIAAAPNTPVVLRDALGILDSAVVSAASVASAASAASAASVAEFRLQGSGDSIEIVAGSGVLRGRPGLRGARSVVVLGDAGWEARFIIAALESRGWRAEPRLRVGPGRWVVQGRPLPLDTTRHDAVIVLGRLDPSTNGAVRRFVSSGGGLVLSGGTFGLEDIAPGRIGQAVRPVAGLGVPESRAQLEYRVLGRLERDASILAPAASGARVAARREGAGRVLQLGDVDTWRLSMASDAGRAEHGALWNRAVAFVSPRDPARPDAIDDLAPRAATVALLGPPASGPARSGRSSIPWTTVAGIILLVSLVLEWASRRLRGEA